ncbi:Gmad2 immunoglobulin-like domain-containing protein [Paenibacillus sp. MMS20-IR301]|uniref:Gmad2 immunoglobulin-like domain-containing protein n=1 Tax=Paenibacillus sp. MMS20-IR301 TaxID=2895946 RepID=UPI0028ECE65C|nr:Gmad2 immunoglobulin-like domain-containing protein [Paenibacillus sp. MMS20-IR301]WNS44292.1 Gmad2 immunoglobulin-like domain-containing protein [Paenibacillus sp. MMS20-IR301]
MSNAENLSAIAVKFNVNIDELARSNALPANYSPEESPVMLTIPGLSLEIPGVYYNVNSNEHLYSIGFRFLASPNLIAGINPSILNANRVYIGQKLRVPAFIHTAGINDTLTDIANLRGIPFTYLARINEDRPGFTYEQLPEGFDVLIPLPSSKGTLITQPVPGTRIGDDVSLTRIQGVASEFEGNFLYRVLDEDNHVLMEGAGTAPWTGNTTFGAFDFPLDLTSPPTTPRGKILIFAYNESSGSLIDLAETRIYF